MALSISKLIFGFVGKGIDLVMDRFTRGPQVETDEDVLKRQLGTLDEVIARQAGGEASVSPPRPHPTV